MTRLIEWLQDRLELAGLDLDDRTNLTRLFAALVLLSLGVVCLSQSHVRFFTFLVADTHGVLDATALAVWAFVAATLTLVYTFPTGLFSVIAGPPLLAYAWFRFRYFGSLEGVVFFDIVAVILLVGYMIVSYGRAEKINTARRDAALDRGLQD